MDKTNKTAVSTMFNSITNFCLQNYQYPNILTKSEHYYLNEGYCKTVVLECIRFCCVPNN